MKVRDSQGISRRAVEMSTGLLEDCVKRGADYSDVLQGLMTCGSFIMRIGICCVINTVVM